MCHRTNQTFTTCGHTIQEITKCRDPLVSKSRWRCVSLRELPERKTVGGKCLHCELKKANEQFQARMAAIVRGGQVERKKVTKGVERAESTGEVEVVDGMESAGKMKGVVVKRIGGGASAAAADDVFVD